MDGLFILDKPAGMTSQTAVRRVARLLGADKAGHTGTLDPMATGVLPILLGRGVKAAEFLLTGEKHYLATLKLGVTTDTEDTTGAVLTAFTGTMPAEEKVRDAVASFVGVSRQTPPMYSALKVGGQKLCDLARRGVEIEREAREITVFSIETQKIGEDEYALDVICSKGTYIRTLCADIGRALGVGGCMASLRRLEAAGYRAENAVTLDALENMTEAERQTLVLPVEAVFEKWPRVTLSPFFAKLGAAGQPLYQKKLGTDFPLGTRVALYDADGFFALAEAQEKDGDAVLKPIRQILLRGEKHD